MFETNTSGLFLVLAQGNIVHREVGITSNLKILNRIQYAHGWPDWKKLRSIRMRVTRCLKDYDYGAI